MLLREYRRSAKGLADLVPWGVLVAPGVVLNKDGSFLAAWSYRGPDVESSTPTELRTLSAQLNRALISFASDWMVHVDAIRARSASYPPPGAFPDPVTRAIDEERRVQYEDKSQNFETRYVLTLTYMPPRETTSKLLGWFVEGGEARALDWRQQVSLFERRLDDFEDLLSKRLSLDRLSSERLLEHLHFCLTGIEQPLQLPDTPCYLDALLVDQDLVGGFTPRIGNRHLAPIGLTGFPLHTTPAALSFLDRLPATFRFSSRWIPLDSETASRHIRRFRRKWWQKRRGLTDYISDALSTESRRRRGFPNRDAVQMARDADRAISEATSQTARYGYYTPVVLLADSDESALQASVRLVKKQLRNNGFGARLEDVNALEAYLGSLPGVGHANVRRPLLSTRNLADLLPMTSVWAGSPVNPSPLLPPDSPTLVWASTSGSTPFRLNLHLSDVGHTLVIGPTGSGKSTLLALLQAQWFRYPDAQVFCFDKGLSARPLVLRAGGDHYDIGAEEVDALSFCPLASVAEARERVWAAEWLEVLFDLQGVEVHPGHRAAIQRALELLASIPRPTLTDLEVRLQDAELREALRPYTLKGNLGSLLDAREDGLRDGRFQVFEMGHLMEMKEKIVVPLLLYLFHRLEQRLDGRPTLLVIDEAWTFLMHGLFAEKIQSWLKELRKKNAAVVFSTQSLADINRSEKRFVLYESCPTKILLPNSEAASDIGAGLYRDLGLNDSEVEVIASATAKQDYYYHSPEGRRLVQLALGDEFLGALESVR